MNPRTFSRGIAFMLLLGCTPFAHAQAPQAPASDAKVSAIEALKIPDGTITFLRREEPPG